MSFGNGLPNGLKRLAARLARRLTDSRNSGDRSDMLRRRSSRRFIVGAAVVTLTLWGGYSTWSFLDAQSVIDRQTGSLVETRAAYRELLDAWGVAGDRVASAADALRGHLADLRRIAASKREYAAEVAEIRVENAQLRRALDVAEKARQEMTWAYVELGRDRDHLEGQLVALEAEILALAAGEDGMTPMLDDPVIGYFVAANGPDDDADMAARMRFAVDALATRLEAVYSSRREIVCWVSQETQGQIELMEEVIEDAGLDPDDVAPTTAELEPTTSILSYKQTDCDWKNGLGGPFVALPTQASPAEELRDEVSALDVQLARWGTLREVYETLPFGAPLARYVVRSSFGPRRDPLNRRRAFHYGVDLGAPYGASVFATAPGQVAFAGWRRGYGRVVEILHGHGIRTRFAHLSAIKVRKGQPVDRGKAVGRLGASGRTTGAHLHYEILIDGVPRNPMDFIKQDSKLLGDADEGISAVSTKRVGR